MKKGRRKSSTPSAGPVAVSEASPASPPKENPEEVPPLDGTPDPPVSSRGRQRKINPKYIDDGDVAAMFYRKKR